MTELFSATIKEAIDLSTRRGVVEAWQSLVGRPPTAGEMARAEAARAALYAWMVREIDRLRVTAATSEIQQLAPGETQ
jgi:hypothetical protein